MGKKGKRTKWRKLTPNGQESDSESSSTAPSFTFSKSYQPKYSKYSYSSQSTPTRKFQYEGKSTRSSSTASEQKITFNEDEYTRITTPRQDVLFKKGYLNKPKNYHTQTSTGTTCSTANSTSTCTPDHHSADGAEGTDLEYESQFVFPPFFVDQNGIYYVNSLEPFPPFVVYNTGPAYYPQDYHNSKTKRYSTDSAVESASPNNEEACSNGPVTNGALDAAFVSGVPVFRQDFVQSSVPVNGFHANGPPQNDLTKDQYVPSNDARRLKKRRRKRASSSQPSQEGPVSSEHTDEYESDEVLSQSESGSNVDSGTCNPPSSSPLEAHQNPEEATIQERIVPESQAETVNNNPLPETLTTPSNTHDDQNIEDKDNCDIRNDNAQEEIEKCEERIDGMHVVKEENRMSEENCSQQGNNEGNITNCSIEQSVPLPQNCNDNSCEDGALSVHSKTDNVDCSETYPVEEVQRNIYQLKPDAEEFVPRALRHPQHLPLDPALQFVNLPPTYLPIPIISPITSVPTTPQQAFPAVFLPSPTIPPLNFVPPPLEQKIISNLQPNPAITQNTQPPPINEEVKEKIEEEKGRKAEDVEEKTANSQEEVTKVIIQTTNESHAENMEPVAVVTKKPQNNQIDIAQIVLKLEEAAKEQDVQKPQQNNYKPQNKFNRLPQKAYNGDNRQKVPMKTKLYNRRNETSPKIYGNRQNHQFNQSPKRMNPSFFQNAEVRSERRTFVQRNTKSFEVAASPNRSPTVYGEVSKSEIIENVTEKTPNEITDKHTRSSTFENRHSNDQRTYQNVERPRSMNNYSKNLKQSSPNSTNGNCPRYEKYSRKGDRPLQYQRVKSRSSTPQKEDSKTAENVAKKQITSQNQWIPVSSRKNRRNRNFENSTEVEESEVDCDSREADSFESYDVNQLVDVVPKSSEETTEISVEIENKNEVQNMENSSEELEGNDRQIQPKPLEAQSEELVDNLTCTKIEETTILPDTVEHDFEKEATSIESFNNEIETFNINDKKEEKIEDDSSERAFKNKSTKERAQNKSTKKHQKSVTRKVIITDPDVSLTLPTNNSEITETNENKETIGNVNEKEKIPEGISESVELYSKPNEELLEAVEELEKENEVKNTEDRGLKNEEVDVKKEENDLKSSESPEKKAKKKKKKPSSKTNLRKNRSASNSSTKLNLDDPYNFLLEDIALEDSEKKTNEEISEELDRVIQRGMYSNLEEKIKTIKVNDSEDQFFKMFNFNFLQKKPTHNNTSSIKITELTSALKSAVFGPGKSTETQKAEDFSKVKFPEDEEAPQPSTSRSGFFLENPETSELIKNVNNNTVDVGSPPLFQLCMVEHIPLTKSKTKDKSKCKNNRSSSKNERVPVEPVVEIKSEELKHESKEEVEDEDSPKNSTEIEFFRESKNNDETREVIEPKNEGEEEERKDDEDEDEVLPLENGKETLYPITQAVREWMTKTRENTPDVEILKSPDVIYKELIDIESETETEPESTTEQASKLGMSNGKPLENGYSDIKKMAADEDVTVFSATDNWSLSPQTSIEEEDLLDCWENEIPRNENETNAASKRKTSKMNGTVKSCRNGCINEDEDILEVYESKYGKNEDYLKLKAEIEEQRKHMNFPKHGNLPYRAICCNLM